MRTFQVVFLDEASLPDEKKMVLKVLHPYLDECKVAFVAITNKSFDAANANRMLCVYRSLPSQDDQRVLAYGCLGLPVDSVLPASKKDLDQTIIGLCEGYRRILARKDIPKIFHDRDFIYMLRQLRFELPSVGTTDDNETTVHAIKPINLLRALEDNFNGISKNEFRSLVNDMFESIQQRLPSYRLPAETLEQKIFRDVPTILEQSLKLDPRRRRLYGRYKLIIDESDDESAINLLRQAGIIQSDPQRTMVFRMSDFEGDLNNDLRNVEILSKIKLCMETGKTVLMVNTSRIHGSLYDVFNQNFSIMATEDTRKIFSKVAIGPKTIDVVVHEDFQCLVHVKRSEVKDLPAPFLSRFQKFTLSIHDFYRIQLSTLSKSDQDILNHVETRSQSFIDHIGKQYFHGLNDSTLYSCLLPLIVKHDNENPTLGKIASQYNQLTIRAKGFVEQDPNDSLQCYLRFVLVKLVQLLSPESVVVALATLEETVKRWLSKLYFQGQDHFNLEHFLQQLLFHPADIESDNVDASMNLQSVQTTRKVVIFTRTSPYIMDISQQSRYDLLENVFSSGYSNQIISRRAQIIPLVSRTFSIREQLNETCA